MHYTSIEQSKKLLVLGLSSNTADILWIKDDDGNFDPEFRINVVESTIKEGSYIPSWSLGALLKLIPYGAVASDNYSNTKYYAYSYHSDCLDYSFYGDSPLEAAYNMVVWFLVNKKDLIC